MGDLLSLEDLRLGLQLWPESVHGDFGSWDGPGSDDGPGLAKGPCSVDGPGSFSFSI